MSSHRGGRVDISHNALRLAGQGGRFLPDPNSMGGFQDPTSPGPWLIHLRVQAVKTGRQAVPKPQGPWTAHLVREPPIFSLGV